jgi:hypothetical protein
MQPLKILTVFMTLATIIFLCNACEKTSPVSADPLGYQYMDQEFLTKKPAQEDSYTYPIWGKMNFYNKKGVWQGGTIILSNGSKFTVETGALTPPHPLASSVYVSIRADFDSLKNEIVFSFTPSGCVFSPPAELIFDYNDLGIDIATLNYIDENGEYILQTPDHIDYQKRTITIYIDHFSRYAIGME